MARIELKGVCKTLADRERVDARRTLIPFGEGRAADRLFRIEGLNLEIPDGKVMAVLGPSGCGKSTLLRIIAGLMPADSGSVLFDGVSVDDMPPGERKIGMVFQNYALYPNYDSKTNVISYYMFHQKTPELEAEKEAKYRRTADLLGVDIEKLMDRMPKGLSGGEQQRVAVARCITRDPRLFLLDEPFSNLDQKLREKYRIQLRVLLKQFNITTVYVTHDQVEALILADLIALMNMGRIEQVGTAQEIYDEPRSIFAADFLNFEPEAPSINLVDGERVSSELKRYTVGARPDRISIGRREGALGISGRIADIHPLPMRKSSIIRLRAEGVELFFKVDNAAGYADGIAEGSSVDVSFDQCHLFDKESGLRIKTMDCAREPEAQRA
jgi:multiple sugar transport system ATP-binding protein